MKRPVTLLLLVFFPISFTVYSQQLLPPGITPNGSISAMDSKDGIVYIGGFFNDVGYLTGGAAMIDGSKNLPDLNFPHIDGEVYAIIPDGTGGWFIGGEFDQAESAPNVNIVHILSDYTIDQNFNIILNNKVNALALKDNILYLGGKFTQADNNNRNYVAAYDLTQKALTSFNPAPSSEIFTIEIYQDYLIIGGFFQQVGGINQPRLAKISLSTGTNEAIPTPPVGFVYDLLIKGDTVYVAGTFSNCLMAVNLADNTIVDWAPSIPGFGPRVNTMALVDTVIYFGGNFNKVNNADRKSIAAVSINGNLTSFQADADAEVHEIYPDGDSLYIGGDFKNIANADLPHAAKIDIITGKAATWRTNPSWAIRSFIKTGDKLLMGGEIRMLQRVERDNACAIDIATGELTDWNPQSNFAPVIQLKVDQLKDRVYLAGHDSQTSKHFKAFDAQAGDALPDWDFVFDNAVKAIDQDPNTGNVYLAGSFTTINGEPHGKLAGINPNGGLIPLNTTVNNAVDYMAFSPDHNLIYFAGNFQNVNNQSRYKLAAINQQGELQNWYPRIDSLASLYGVFDLVPTEDKVYLAGNWNTINGATDQKHLAAVHPINGTLLPFNPKIEANQVYEIERAGNGLFIVGTNLLKIGNTPVHHLAYIGGESGQVLEDIPDFGAPNQFNVVHWRDDSLFFIGGRFNFLNQKYHPYLAKFTFDIDSNPVPPTVGKVVIERLLPKQGGNTGSVTLEIIGSGFKEGTQVQLIGDGFEDISFNVDSSFIIENKILAHFNLRGTPVGLRDLEVMVPDNDTILLGGAFSIEAGTEAQPWADVVAPYFVTARKEEFFYLSYGNKGNVDAIGVPVWLAVSPNIEIENIGFKMFDIFDPADPFYDSIPEYVLVDSLAGKPFPAKVYGFIIPRIEALSSKMVRFTIKGAEEGNFYTRAWATEPLFGSPLKYAFGPCADTWISNAIGFVPVVGCSFDIADAALSPIFDYMYDPDFGSANWANNYMQLLTTTALGCAGEILAPGVGGVILEIAEQGLKAKGTIELWQKCYPASDQDSLAGEFVASCDPNDKSGPNGRGEKGWINTDQRFPYMIRFENDPEATAPAKEVIIRDTLDHTVFDLSSLQLKGFAIADSFYIIPSGFSEYTMTIDLQPRLPYLVESDVKLNPDNGLLTWKFTTLDPVSKEPVTDPIGGFLPPSLDTLSGQGAIFFDIALYDTISNGREINNKAAIYFDFNDPIITNTWKLAADNGGISSSVNPLNETQVETDILLQWSGTDEGSGILYYDVLFRKDNEEWLYAAVQTKATSLTFPGETDSEYEFYTIAYDSALNIELAPMQADARISLVNEITSLGNDSENGLVVYPNPAASEIRIRSNYPGKAVDLALVSLAGKIIWKQKISQNKLVSIASLPVGIYVLKWKSDLEQGQVKLVKQ